MKPVPSLSFPFAFRVCRRYLPLRANGWINRKAIHQSHEFFTIESPGLISSPGPLETSICKPDIKENIPVTGPQELFRCFSYSDRIKKNIYESCYDLDSIGISYLRKAIQFFDKLIIILPFRKICCCSISSLAFFNCSSFHFCIRICVNPS